MCFSYSVCQKCQTGNDGNVQHHLKSLIATTLSDIVARCSDVDFIERRMAMVKAFMSLDPIFDLRTKTTTVGTLLMMEHRANEVTHEQEHRQKELWDRYLSYLEETIITTDTMHKANMYVEQMFKLAKRDLTSAPANETRSVKSFLYRYFLLYFVFCL
jgi:transcriptional regulator with PAS, ATPase and Fis domain